MIKRELMKPRGKDGAGWYLMGGIVEQEEFCIFNLCFSEFGVVVNHAVDPVWNGNQLPYDLS